MNYDEIKKGIEFYKENGYIVFNIDNDDLIDKVNDDVDKHLNKGQVLLAC